MATASLSIDLDAIAANWRALDKLSPSAVQTAAAGEAEAQRAKLSLMGLEARVSEREQSGRQVFRVRLGPFDRKDDADRSKARLDAGGIESALVRVQR